MSFSVEIIRSPNANQLNPPSCTYAISSWERAYTDLDAIHRRGEDRNEAYFLGHKYLLHSTTIEYEGRRVVYDFILQRIADAKRWKPLCVCYMEDEESPCEADDEYLEPVMEYAEYEGWCFTCQCESGRNCSECGISICDGCSFGKTMCKWCILDQL